MPYKCKAEVTTIFFILIFDLLKRCPEELPLCNTRTICKSLIYCEDVQKNCLRYNTRTICKSFISEPFRFITKNCISFAARP
ncbi:hypothetical protein CDAR_167461 [Caerostris darwini]|uniref:Uncharacterized protein n=1 Tax=Caerostris darwini TaxID=1538125 RepID=A0AAV4NFT0_9ARAC|nr:hypothetical protein CDAR_167461 [Caerostris darwini]